MKNKNFSIHVPGLNFLSCLFRKKKKHLAVNNKTCGAHIITKENQFRCNFDFVNCDKSDTSGTILHSARQNYK